MVFGWVFDEPWMTTNEGAAQILGISETELDRLLAPVAIPAHRAWLQTPEYIAAYGRDCDSPTPAE